MTKEETNNDFFVTLKKQKFKQKILSRNLKKNHLKLFSLKFISYLLSYNIIYECTTFSELKKQSKKKTHTNCTVLESAVSHP